MRNILYLWIFVNYNNIHYENILQGVARFVKIIVVLGEFIYDRSYRYTGES